MVLSSVLFVLSKLVTPENRPQLSIQKYSFTILTQQTPKVYRNIFDYKANDIHTNLYYTETTTHITYPARYSKEVILYYS